MQALIQKIIQIVKGLIMNWVARVEPQSRAIREVGIRWRSILSRRPRIPGASGPEKTKAVADLKAIIKPWVWTPGRPGGSHCCRSGGRGRRVGPGRSMRSFFAGLGPLLEALEKWLAEQVRPWQGLEGPPGRPGPDPYNDGSPLRSWRFGPQRSFRPGGRSRWKSRSPRPGPAPTVGPTPTSNKSPGGCMGVRILQGPPGLFAFADLGAHRGWRLRIRHPDPRWLQAQQGFGGRPPRASLAGAPR